MLANLAIRHAHVERGENLSVVRDLMGHASVLTTERYDNQKLLSKRRAIGRLQTSENSMKNESQTSSQLGPSASANT